MNQLQQMNVFSPIIHLRRILKGSGNMTPPNARIFHQGKNEGKCGILDRKLTMKI